MSAGPELSIRYSQQEYCNTALHQEYNKIQQQQHMNQLPQYFKGSQHDQLISHSSASYDDGRDFIRSGAGGQQNTSRHHNQHFRVVSPPLSVASSSTSSSTSSYFNTTTSTNNKNSLSSTTTKLPLLQQPTKPAARSNSMVSQTGQGQGRQSTGNFTWLVFMNEKWVPFDIINQTKLEQTLTDGGTFVDIIDSHFPDVKRVRVFPRNNYLSYLGVKYRLSRIMQPDAYLDHVAVAEAKQQVPSTSAANNTLVVEDNNASHNRNRRAWEI